MRIKFTLFLSLFFGLTQVNAQLSDGSIAPDFSITTQEGDTINLYELLDEGKTVILDIFAVWCGPCWSYHETHTLADIYDVYGPEGEDDMFVMALEADNSTFESCLYGPTDCNSTTLGDWTADVPYPVVNNNFVNALYDIAYFPTIYIIYPNRLVEELGQQSFDGIVEKRNDIPKLSAGINPEAIFFRGKNGSTCGPLWPAAPYFVISNMGEEVITSGDITVTKNGEVIYSEQITEPVQPFNPIAEIQISPSLVDESTLFKVLVENINGDPAQSYSTESVINFETNNAIYVSVQTDENSSAHSNRYEIINETGDIVSQVNLGDNNATIENAHFLSEGGCHTFKIYDENGDGINGEVKVTDGDGKLIYSNNGGFNVDISDFNVATVSSVAETLSEESIIIAPNPISDLLQINIDSRTGNQLDICVVNVYGQAIAHTISKNESSISFDATNWAQGIYFVFVQDGNSKISKQIVKN